jgi:hypothetical protein
VAAVDALTRDALRTQERTGKAVQMQVASSLRRLFSSSPQLCDQLLAEFLKSK